jgi:thiol-disulfide isomerase/thioredoxin
MKKSLLFILVAWAWPAGLQGQTIVSTEPQNRKVVLEHFGGIYCGYCPSGHQIAAQVQNSHPGKVSVINIHTGYFATPAPGDPDLRTNWGHALDLLSGNGQAYPAGTVNRRVFPGWEFFDSGTTALSRNKWAAAADQMLGQPSPVNVAVQADFNAGTNVLTVYTEIYYTADSQQPVNYLNVALLQNNIAAPQVLANGSIDEDYILNEVLRDLLTGQWGEGITPTVAGHFVTRTHTYQLPAQIRGIPIDPTKLEVAVFISEGQQEVLNIAQVPVNVNIGNHAVDVNAWEVLLDQYVCEGEIHPAIYIRNDGLNVLNSLQISCTVNGYYAYDYTWYGQLATLESKLVQLPIIPFDWGESASNIMEVTLSAPNEMADGNESNNAISMLFSDPPSTQVPEVLLEIKTDHYGYEIYWELRDQQDGIVASGGNQNVGANGGGQQTAGPNDPGAYAANSFFTQAIQLPWPGCYQFRILDDFADGICCDYGNGFYRLKDVGGNVLFNGGSFGIEAVESFRVSAAVTRAGGESVSALSLFPNPASDLVILELNLEQSSRLDISVFNALGRPVLTLEEISVSGGPTQIPLDVSRLEAGVYLLQLEAEGKRISRKFVVHR